MSTTLNKFQIDKLGNTLIYLSKNVGDFGKTKILKLLFLLEEKSIKDFGVPFFGFDFEVWQYGPVVEQIFEDLNGTHNPFLNSYIQRASWNPDEFEAIAEFNDDEFSNNDIYLMEKIINLARHKTAKNLVDITHGEGSLWRKTAKENGVLDKFEAKTLTKTNILIDFTTVLENDGYLKERYEGALDFLQFTKQIKS
jgi:uncharacterized phage-associated protein